MAIQLNETIREHMKEALLDPAYTGPLERGMVMIYSAAVGPNGEALLTPSTGAGTDVVAGILWLSETTQEEVPLFEDADVPAAGALTVTLKFTPTAVGEMRAIRTDTGAAITVVAGAPGASELGLVGKVLTADAALAGLPIRVTYKYTISAVELARRGGRRSVNQGAEQLYNQVTIVYGQCKILLSNFDTEDAWDVDANVNVLTGAGGNISLDGAGVLFARKVQKPTLFLSPGIEQAFVGIECNLPGV